MLKHGRIDPHVGGVFEAPMLEGGVPFDLKHSPLERQVFFAAHVVQTDLVRHRVMGQAQVLHKLAGAVFPKPDLAIGLAHRRHHVPQGLAQPGGIARRAHAQRQALVEAQNRANGQIEAVTAARNGHHHVPLEIVGLVNTVAVMTQDHGVVLGAGGHVRGDVLRVAILSNDQWTIQLLTQQPLGKLTGPQVGVVAVSPCVVDTVQRLIDP